ncbi:MAG: hypothetical protein Q7S21_07925 [archaeon]|nr:hypothetical protein [archaeon]
MQFLEINSYAQKQDEITQELSIMGETAADLITSNGMHTCIVGGGAGVGASDYNTLANNCLTLCSFTGTKCDNIPVGADESFFENSIYAKKIFKKRIGLTSEYECNIELNPLPYYLVPGDRDLQHECEDSIPGTNGTPEKANIYSTTRKVILPDTSGFAQWNKKEYLNCIRNTGECNAEISTLTLTIWKK